MRAQPPNRLAVGRRRTAAAVVSSPSPPPPRSQRCRVGAAGRAGHRPARPGLRDRRAASGIRNARGRTALSAGCRPREEGVPPELSHVGALSGGKELTVAVASGLPGLLSVGVPPAQAAGGLNAFRGLHRAGRLRGGYCLSGYRVVVCGCARTSHVPPVRRHREGIGRRCSSGRGASA